MLSWLLPFFLSQTLGAKTAAIGLIEGAAETTASILKIVSGWISDRVGHRKWFAVAGYAISTVSKPFLLLATSWSGVLAIRVGDRFGKGIRTAPRDALLADSVEPRRRGLAFGIHRAGDTAGALIGVLIALVAIELSGPEARILSPAVFRLLVVLSLIPAALAVIGLALLVREPRSTRRLSSPDPPSQRPMGRRFWVFVAIMVVFTLGNSADAFLVLRAQRAGLTLTGVLFMVLMYNLVYSALSGPAGALSDRIGRRRVLTAGWVVYGLIYLGFATLSTGRQAFFLMAAYGLYAAMADGVAKAMVADLVPPQRRGTAFGIFHTSVGLAAMPASVIAGILWEGVGEWPGWGPSAPFCWGAGMAALASILLAVGLPTPGTPPTVSSQGPSSR